MKPLRGPLRHVRAARLRTEVSQLDRTLVVVESQELFAGQKRGVQARLDKAREEMRVVARRVLAGKLRQEALAARTKKILAPEHLHEFVVVEIGGTEAEPTLPWRVDAARRRRWERQFWNSEPKRKL